jgi:hypothetical protein
VSAPDYYEQHLLGLAVKACAEKGYDLTIPAVGEPLTYRQRGTIIERYGTRAKQLRALLDDLGVEYEERPSAERVEEAQRVREYVKGGEFSQAEDLGHLAKVITLSRLRKFYAREPLTVLALLAGER